VRRGPRHSRYNLSMGDSKRDVVAIEHAFHFISKIRTSRTDETLEDWVEGLSHENFPPSAVPLTKRVEWGRRAPGRDELGYLMVVWYGVRGGWRSQRWPLARRSFHFGRTSPNELRRKSESRKR
jgi:hypothetical protein